MRPVPLPVLVRDRKRRPTRLPITICIPAYRPARFIERCLNSVAAQTFRDFRVRISNDGGHDRELLDRLAAQHGAEVTHHQHRLGWVGNSNHLIERVTTAYFCILPQDDELDPAYLARTHAHLESHRKAIAAFSDISCVFEDGSSGPTMKGAAVTGGRRSRIRTVLDHHFNGYSYRALIRSPGDLTRIAMPEDTQAGFAADSAWIMTKSLLGELHCLPEPLYTKHFHDRNTHSGWWTGRDAAGLSKNWFDHCLSITRIALSAAATRGAARDIAARGSARLLRPWRETDTPFDPAIGRALRATWTRADLPALAREFKSRLENPRHARRPCLPAFRDVLARLSS